jgi:hypothetical protein
MEETDLQALCIHRWEDNIKNNLMEIIFEAWSG